MTSPRDCPPGYYCPAGTVSAFSNPCPSGSYNRACFVFSRSLNLSFSELCFCFLQPRSAEIRQQTVWRVLPVLTVSPPALLFRVLARWVITVHCVRMFQRPTLVLLVLTDLSPITRLRAIVFLVRLARTVRSNRPLLYRVAMVPMRL
jgi:hypothetical protein